MSKSEEKTATGDARNQNLQYNQNAQSTYQQAQGDIGDYEGQLAKFSAANPYVQGGQFQTAQTQQAADTAAAGAQSAGQAMQAAAVRSGENPAGAIAATEQVAQANNQNLAGEEAQQTQQRLGLMAGYNQNVLSASAVPEQMEAGLTSAEAGAANNALGQEVGAAKQPSYLDELVQGGIAAGDAFAGGYGGQMAKGCWVAARLWGGWSDTRVVLLRLWLEHEFRHTWLGRRLHRLYGRYGKRIAEEWMPKSKLLTWAMEWIFTAALAKSAAWYRGERGRGLLVAYLRLEQGNRQWVQRDPHGFSDWAVEQAGRGC